METYSIIGTILTLVAGGGWFIYYRANKMKAYGEAWETQQRVYQNTIADLEKTCEFIRKDRDLLRQENEELRKENMELRNKVNSLEGVILDIRKEVARQGRRIETLTNKSKKQRKEDNNENIEPRN